MRALALTFLALLAACRPTPPEPSPPSTQAGVPHNVLLITIDALRADHMGAYGYPRPTSPQMDALGRAGTVFEQAYTYWPKTRGSFVMLLTGRYPSQNGYSKKHPQLLSFNPTLASVLAAAGYRAEAIVDNPNVAARLGYSKGFERYRETWEEAALESEMDRTRAISEDGVRLLRERKRDRPFLLWLHYVNPHTPYTPPAPFDTTFLDASSREGQALPVVSGLHGGIPKQWAVPGEDRLAYYVAQYDGEIAAVDEQVGRVLKALRESGEWDRTVVVLTSDHGESLGEHDYFFDHGENLFDPCLRVPLMVVVPGAPAGGRSRTLASTLDLVPTVLDVVKVSYPPGLAGTSLLRCIEGRGEVTRERLFAGNERNLAGVLDQRHKLVATPTEKGFDLGLYDRARDPGETRDLSRDEAARRAQLGAELHRFLAARDAEWERTRALVEGQATEATRMTRQACERLKALGYVDVCPP
jgi:arylsulfatase A-like enzyme